MNLIKIICLLYRLDKECIVTELSSLLQGKDEEIIDLNSQLESFRCQLVMVITEGKEKEVKEGKEKEEREVVEKTELENTDRMTELSSQLSNQVQEGKVEITKLITNIENLEGQLVMVTEEADSKIEALQSTAVIANNSGALTVKNLLSRLDLEQSEFSERERELRDEMKGQKAEYSENERGWKIKYDGLKEECEGMKMGYDGVCKREREREREREIGYDELILLCKGLKDERKVLKLECEGMESKCEKLEESVVLMAGSERVKDMLLALAREELETCLANEAVKIAELSVKMDIKIEEARKERMEKECLVTELSSQLQEKKEEIIDLTFQLESFRGQLQEGKDKIADLTTQLEDSLLKILSLESDLNSQLQQVIVDKK
jgi:predicted phage tail protein